MQVNINTGKELNWVVTLLMSIFFGYLGVDRFMMGHIGLGLLKLITCGGFGVWWLVDMILIATRHQYKNVTWISQLEEKNHDQESSFFNPAAEGLGFAWEP